MSYQKFYPFQYILFLKIADTREFNFTSKPPIWINIVRHPVERIRSWYYYIRGPAYQLQTMKEENNKTTTVYIKGGPSIKRLKTTFEECVLQKVMLLPESKVVFGLVGR